MSITGLQTGLWAWMIQKVFREVAGRVRLHWTGGDWASLQQSDYVDYLDLDLDHSADAPQPDVAPENYVNLGIAGSRLMNAVIRDGVLWTCHHVGLDGIDGDYDGGTPDRSAIQWLKLHVETSGTLTYQ